MPSEQSSESSGQSSSSQETRSQTSSQGGGRGYGGRGRGNGGRGNGGRGRGRGRDNRNQGGLGSSGATTGVSHSFKGPIKQLENYVFQTRAENPRHNQFQTTTEQLETYLSVEYKDNAEHIKFLLENLETPEITRPTKPKKSSDDFEKEAWKFQVKATIDAELKLRQTLVSVYAVIWGQCSPIMQAKLEALEEYDDMKEKSDVAQLLLEIRGICYQFESHICPTLHTTRHLKTTLR